ncbi:MAG: undecaprenyl-diphosphate phosphatase [Holosporaceae bacterium]|jgi:undecaprenyl-diphosphatase|nr:undecaprenyl-diphosphate phosphatase [Holosporaceae bacterium]
MTSLQGCFLGAVQGVTEFLPVSSSAHLLIFSKLLDIPPHGRIFDTLLNVGSLLAITVFFRKQIRSLILGFGDALTGKKGGDRDFFWTIFLASLPTIVVFGAAEIIFRIDVEAPTILATSLIGFGLLLHWSDQRPVEEREISRKDGVLIGLAQTTSLIPGVSRLGACLMISRWLNHSRREGFRYAMVLSAPATAGACFLRSLKLVAGEATLDNWWPMAGGVVAAFVFGMISLVFMDKFLQRHTLLAFVIYRILLGTALLILHE